MEYPFKIRIAITGPESTGKSVLTHQLAKHYNAVAVDEFARDYVANLGRPYTYDDILYIAQQQMLSEDNAAMEAPFVFCDTELVVTKIWCEVKYQRCHPWILEELKKRRYDLVLICNTDIPWKDDPLREHPHMRKELMRMYFDQIHRTYFNVYEVSEVGSRRVENAIKAVDQTLAILRYYNEIYRQ